MLDDDVRLRMPMPLRFLGVGPFGQRRTLHTHGEAIGCDVAEGVTRIACREMPLRAYTTAQYGPWK